MPPKHRVAVWERLRLSAATQRLEGTRARSANMLMPALQTCSASGDFQPPADAHQCSPSLSCAEVSPACLNPHPPATRQLRAPERWQALAAVARAKHSRRAAGLGLASW